MDNNVAESLKLTQVADTGTALEREEAIPQLTLGQWYWVSQTCEWDGQKSGMKKGDKYEWFGCVMAIGSNYVELHTPHHQGHSYVRVHFEDVWTRLRYEPSPDAVIDGRVGHYQGEATRLMAEVQRTMSRLGLKPVGALPSEVHNTGEQSQALVALSGQVDIKGYQSELVRAKENVLPDLFKQIKAANEELTRWMIARTMPMKALMAPMEESIDEIKDRIFSVSLYAGLTEDVVACCEGEPAEPYDKLHVMQRRLYMDEECLLNYRHGGMEFKDIREFDEWLVQPENRDRILPFPRTLVAMQVRRREKVRDSDLSTFVRISLAKQDELTFLYIRNGEQVWRMNCAMDFGELIFPDKSMYSPDEPKMVKMFAGRVDRMMSKLEYDHMVQEYHTMSEKKDAWKRDNPQESWIHNPYGGMGSELRLSTGYFNPADWKPVDNSNVHYDECLAEINRRIKEYNRVALIIQGLFDRSPVLHPHPPVQTWTPEGFARSIQLVYDGSALLGYGTPPDFEAYRAQCNASLGPDSIVTGQHRFWLKQEAERENKRLDSDWRDRSNYRHELFKPYGNEGPGQVSRMAKWKPRSREAVFSWYRERLRERARFGRYDDSAIRVTLTVPAEKLFNISAYVPGDYKQFFRDPRTRANYLRWAPLLLTAEEYHAGALRVQNPV